MTRPWYDAVSGRSCQPRPISMSPAKPPTAPKPPAWAGRAAPGTPLPEAVLGLTEGENGVLKAMAMGLSNAEIGRQIFLAEATVKTHVTHVPSSASATGCRRSSTPTNPGSSAQDGLA